MIYKNFKKYKFNQLQTLKKTYQYIYIFRYNNLTINEIIFLKKNLKDLNYKSLILKQNLINKFFLIKGQGPIMLIYGNNNFNLINNILLISKIKLIYFINNNNIFSNLKMKNISQNNISLNFSIIIPIFKLLHYLKKFKKANIT